jgi:hypothetical protein
LCSAKEIAEFYRRATEAGKFSEDSINPFEKREFKEIERRWLSLARGCKCNSEEARKLRRDVLIFVVVSGNDSNAVIVHTVLSSASLSYAPHPRL